ncbi:PREDICTED: SNARE-interacting protein KEULE-like [Populus euphratica]|uniref:SNARE-interacting protein KEULE-like n=1 Tax=Populus euphratica TaxID=75702 RepID=A0AAJ6UPV0_POPEU|nr:PREDICTED: SNARE-interacting protein KEULE-like [Populus euphratica]XP_011033889.1 PREDICTED: SNARE-interacting protein KEULE-like [Populus euphratica]
MSFSDSDSSSAYGGDYRNFRQISRERLLREMLRSAKTGNSKSTWKVLIMDKLTVKIMSYSCKMADITQEGVSLVEDIYRRRQPLPTMDAIYFIQPTKENVIMFLSDMAGKSPLYKKAFVFFSSPISRELVSHIKKDSSVLTRIGALREMNLEYFAIDSQGFITDNERALEELFGDDEDSHKGDACLNVMASRIATVFASLREFPFVRFRAARSLDVTTMTTSRDLIPTKLAARIWDALTQYKQKIEHFPQTETCELLILDRSIDQIAPVIHEWTYDAMCHDLLNMEGNKYVHEVPGKAGGPPEKKEVLLEEHDPVWLELRHAHIAFASERLHEKMTNFVSKNKAAKIQHGSRDGGELSTRDLQQMVQALPQYSEQIDKLSLHVEIAGKINRIIRELGLRELGQLEQDLVFGDAGMKDVIKFLTTKEDATRENKLRLLMILAAVFPEKLEGERGLNIMKLARLPRDDMNAVNNMRLLAGASDTKKRSTGAFSLKFDIHKKKRAARKDRTGEEETTWQLSRFYPMIEELIDKLNKGELSKDEYPCMNDPSPSFHGTSQSTPMHHVPAPHSMRSKRTPTWARPRNSDDGYSSDSILRHASSDSKKMGQRIFVFIVGGATRSELRVCHKLTSKLQREVILGSSSLDDPPQFITKLKLLTANELSLDDLQI